MRRALALLGTVALVLATTGTAIARPPFDEHPGKGHGQEKKAEKAENAPDKTEICHYSEEDGTYHVISIPEPALEAHLAHGDAYPVEVDEENRKGLNGRLDCTQITLTEEESFDLSPEAVLANGGDYENDDVQNAIDAGYTGEVSLALDVETGEVVFSFTFMNLVPGEIYTMYLDADGGSPGPFTLLDTFTANAFGEGTFQWSTTLAAGDYTYSFWVNQPSPPASILQTGDIAFTIPA